MNDTTRSALIDRIGTVFRERGYEGATLTQLASATGLGKASLYHHFPGGKAEMAEVLLREAMVEADRLAFARLRGDPAPRERLLRFVSGFGDYLDAQGGICLLGVIALGSARQAHGSRIAGQFRDWRDALRRVFEQAGYKPKRAARAAAELLDALYGAQLMTRLSGDPEHLRRTLKRLMRSLEKAA